MGKVEFGMRNGEGGMGKRECGMGNEDFENMKTLKAQSGTGKAETNNQ
jgi:hypothetical protein